MKLSNIKGNTYYIKGGTNTGIYVFNDNSSLIIDPGLGGTRPSKMMELLKENNIKPKYIINTHEHGDHYEGSSQLKKIDKNIEILSSEEAKIYIDNPKIYGDYTLGGRCNEFFYSKLSKEKNISIKVDKIIEEGKLVLNNDELEIIKLRGHSEGSIGILTKDKILFVGDLFIGSHILNKFDLLLMYDIKEYLESINKVKNIDFEYMVLGHAKEVIEKNKVDTLIKSHSEAVHKYLNQVRDLLKSPITIDNILKTIINNNKLTCNYKEYYFFRSTIVSMIAYLSDLKEIDYKIEQGEMLYYSKKV